MIRQILSKIYKSIFGIDEKYACNELVKAWIRLTDEDKFLWDISNIKSDRDFYVDCNYQLRNYTGIVVNMFLGSYALTISLYVDGVRIDLPYKLSKKLLTAIKWNIERQDTHRQNKIMMAVKSKVSTIRT